MKFSISTNWFEHWEASGEAFSEKAAELGFDELELGYALTENQADGIRRRLDLIGVGSVHAFCPVPVSAPRGHPELYRLADFDVEHRRLAEIHVARSVEFAAGIGADTLVLHAGRIGFGGLSGRLDSRKLRDILGQCGGDIRSPRYMKAVSLALKRRGARSSAMIGCFKSSLDALIPILERNGVTLALENMPYLEGFPDENETSSILRDYEGAPVKAWFDTGHHRVRVNHGWTRGTVPLYAGSLAGIHLNDVVDLEDDHLAPGEGSVDFASLRTYARQVPHMVFEPSPSVGEESLRRSVGFMRGLMENVPCR